VKEVGLVVGVGVHRIGFDLVMGKEDFDRLHFAELAGIACLYDRVEIQHV
jgi:hypothetical protein